MSEFIHGLNLCESFFLEAVKPVFDEEFPELVYDGALIGPGSEVLGFDTPVSMDHHWGPKTQLFVRAEDYERYAGAISAALSRRLPYRHRGISTNFGPPDAIGVQLLQEIDSGPVRHLVYVYTVDAYIESELGFAVNGEPSVAEWLTFPEQKLLGLTAGRVFHSALGDLAVMRQRLTYYPHDVWLYLLACQWTRISQEEAFVGRCGDAGDELGSRLIGARIVRDLLRLCFMMGRSYVPYSKWLGTAFTHLACAAKLSPLFAGVLAASEWRERERCLTLAYEAVARMHNALGITPPLSASVSAFYDRPYQVLNSSRFSAAVRATITDPAVQALTIEIGSINQWVDSTDFLSRPAVSRRLKSMYET